MTSSSVNPCLRTARGFVGNGCVGDVRSPGTSLPGTGALLDRPHRLPRHAIEHEHPTLLRRPATTASTLRPSLRDVDEYRRRRQVVVPEPVVRDLVVPHALARPRSRQTSGLGEQVVAVPLAAIPVVARRAERQVDEPARARRRVNGAQTFVWPWSPTSCSPTSRCRTRRAAGWVLNRQTRLPVRTSNAWMSPGGSRLYTRRSPTPLPTMTRSPYTTGGDVFV